MNELRKIEEIEKENLFKLAEMFRNSLENFSTSVDRSLRYLDKIVVPIIMASKEDKSYNPFSEIIEKYVQHLLIRRFEKEGYNLLPLGYSADLTFESEEYILNIDIKTANIDNLSDFKGTINVGINQMTHVAKLQLERKFLPSPYFVYPTIPPFYKMSDGSRKLILTYGLMFIYPSYKDLIDNIRKEYSSLSDFFNLKLEDALIPIIVKIFNISHDEARKRLEKKPEKSRYTRDKQITESLIRGVFIHEQERDNILRALEIAEDELDMIRSFSSKLRNFTENLRERDIKPIAIVAISVPNGMLKEKYQDDFVSGKDYSKSARYHYKDGIFKVIKEETNEEFPRVIFIDIKNDYLNKLKRYFDRIRILSYKLKEL